MATLRELAFAFARLVARRHHPRFASRNFGIAAYRRQAFGTRRHGRPDKNGGRRRWVSRRRYGPDGGLRHCNRWVQRHHSNGAAGPSTRTVVPREVTPVIPQEAAAEPVVVDEQDAAVPEIAAGEVVAVQGMFVIEDEYEEASVSNDTTDPDELLPPPSAFAVPPMAWLLGGPSADWLADDPEHEFSNYYVPTSRLRTVSPVPDTLQRGSRALRSAELWPRVGVRLAVGCGSHGRAPISGEDGRGRSRARRTRPSGSPRPQSP
uniref:Uncharacterized protein n=1 Tax=Triticum urartu TaxID=4572 RepID=A0A8R7U2D8_TRIUA